LILEGFIYTKDKPFKNGELRWRCMNRTCKGSMILDLENKIKRSIEHNHIANFEECIKTITLNKIKTVALKTNERALDVIVKNLKELNKPEICEIPNLNSIRDGITRIRNKISL
jgi:hypothetical protein